MKTSVYRCAFIFLTVSLSSLAGVVGGCQDRGDSAGFDPPLPYPDDRMAAYIQAGVDSSDFLWYTDLKAAASSFMNEFGYSPDGVSTSDVIILGEGIFHGTVEVELPDKIVTLTMERPFKHKGKDSIWQVVKVKERPWPKKESG
jgi:hypothetical protein